MRNSLISPELIYPFQQETLNVAQQTQLNEELPGNRAALAHGAALPVAGEGQILLLFWQQKRGRCLQQSEFLHLVLILAAVSGASPS